MRVGGRRDGNRDREEEGYGADGQGMVLEIWDIGYRGWKERGGRVCMGVYGGGMGRGWDLGEGRGNVLCCIMPIAPLEDQLDNHLKCVFADRTSDERLNVLSVESGKRGCTISGRILKIDIDGMDQSKFKCPRNLSSSKDIDKLWRPTLHLVGTVAHGVCESYSIVLRDSAVPPPPNK